MVLQKSSFQWLQPKNMVHARYLKRIDDNVYVLNLLNTMHISKTSNVADIYPFYSSDKPLYLNIPDNSRSIFLRYRRFRRTIANEYMDRVAKKKPIPTSKQAGLPLNNHNSWYRSYETHNLTTWSLFQRSSVTYLMVKFLHLRSETTITGICKKKIRLL